MSVDTLKEPLAYQSLPTHIDSREPFPIFSMLLVAFLCALCVVSVIKQLNTSYEL